MSEKNKSDYFDISKAVDEYRYDSIGGVEKTGAALKILGKGLFNVAKFAVKEALPAVAEQAAKTTIKNGNEYLKNNDIDKNKRAEIESKIEKSQEFLDRKREERSNKEQAEQAEQAEYFHITEPKDTRDITHMDSHGYNENKNLQLQFESTNEISKKILDKEPGLVDFLFEFEVSDKDKKRIFVYPNIPKDKLKNSINARHERLYSEKALILIDDTMFCSAKDGILLTDETLSLKKAFSQSSDYFIKCGCSLDELSSFRFSYVSNSCVNSILSILRKYFEAMINWHKTKAEAGFVQSQFALSLFTPLVINNEERLYWLIKSAENGHPTAQHNLGMSLQHIDEMEACRWFELAAGKGNDLSKRRLEDIRSRRKNAIEPEAPRCGLRSIISEEQRVFKNESDMSLINAIKRALNDKE